MFIDTHCHLTDEKLDEKTVLERARQIGVDAVIMPSVSLEDAKRTVELAEKESLYALVGIHPEEVENLYRLAESFSALSSAEKRHSYSVCSDEQIITEAIGELEKLIDGSNKVVGVGEIGLDFYFDKEKQTKTRQLELFKKQLDLAYKKDFPVAIHMREAEEEMREIIKNAGKLPKGQFHCFAGSKQFLDLALSKGFYVSFAGNITYKSADNLREMVRQVPIERLLLETDSPYLSPIPLRGKVNEPANVKIIAEFIAQEIGTELSTLAEITSKNAKCLYSLDI